MMNISVFLPTRKGSQRVLNKNTKAFANINGGLLELKLRQLLEVNTIKEIVLSTNDPFCIEIASNLIPSLSSKLKIIPRPDNLAKDSTNLSDLIQYAATICGFEHILWTHVTSPFFTKEDYEQAIQTYIEGLKNDFDSLMSAKLFKNFLWDKEKMDIINRGKETKRWPRTQDLDDLYEIDSAIFIANRNIYITQKDRIGLKPLLYIQEGIKSFDIDWQSDFDLAEFIYKQKYLK